MFGILISGFVKLIFSCLLSSSNYDVMSYIPLHGLKCVGDFQRLELPVSQFLDDDMKVFKINRVEITFLDGELLESRTHGNGILRK